MQASVVSLSFTISFQILPSTIAAMGSTRNKITESKIIFCYIAVHGPSEGNQRCCGKDKTKKKNEATPLNTRNHVAPQLSLSTNSTAVDQHPGGSEKLCTGTTQCAYTRSRSMTSLYRFEHAPGINFKTDFSSERQSANAERRVYELGQLRLCISTRLATHRPFLRTWTCNFVTRGCLHDNQRISSYWTFILLLYPRDKAGSHLRKIQKRS